MNRNGEYEQLMQELDALTVPEGGIGRALRRRRLNRYLLHPLTSIAAVLALFVILVNASETVAHACSQVPGLRELAEAVTFSRSLSDAVANGYVQTVGLEQTKDGVTVRVESLIVDRKSVSVFYRVESERYARLEAEPEFAAADGSGLAAAAWAASSCYVPDGELRSAYADAMNVSLPGSLRFRLKLWDVAAGGKAGDPAVSVWDQELPEPVYVAEFDFLLEFDPYFAAQGKHVDTEVPIVLGEQLLYITGVDVYPSCLSFSVRGDAANTAWLKGLRFYLMTDRGERFEPVAQGISATGDPDTPEITTFRADSSFFYGGKAVTLYVTGAEWLDRDKETVRVDLKNGTADFMPEGAELFSAEREGSRWVVTLLINSADGFGFLPEYADADGRTYVCQRLVSCAVLPDGTSAPEGCGFVRFFLEDYPCDEVWLRPRMTSRWVPETPAEAVIPLG